MGITLLCMCSCGHESHVRTHIRVACYAFFWGRGDCGEDDEVTSVHHCGRHTLLLDMAGMWQDEEEDEITIRSEDDVQVWLSHRSSTLLQSRHEPF